MNCKKNTIIPLSLVQKEVLVRTVTSAIETRICYRDIISIFQWMGVSLYSKEEIIGLILKGGNAFLNHFIFCLMYMREWTDESKDVFHVHDLALRLHSALSPQLYRYVWVRVQSANTGVEIEVLERGKGWYVNPFDARDNGITVKAVLSNPFLSDCFSPILMLESTCTCLIYLDDAQRQESQGIKCNCVRDWESAARLCVENKGYDEIDALETSTISCDEGYASNSSLDTDTIGQKFAIIDGIKVIQKSSKDVSFPENFEYVIEHNNVHFTSKNSDVKSAYEEYICS